MSEWPDTCRHGDHYGKPVLARWVAAGPVGERYFYCTKHSHELGPRLKLMGYKWSKLPEPILAQPSSERESS